MHLDNPTGDCDEIFAQESPQTSKHASKMSRSPYWSTLAAAAVALSTAASAATFVVNFSGSAASSPGAILSVDSFDTSIGELTGVQLDLTVQLHGPVVLSNDLVFPVPDYNGNVSFDQHVTFDGAFGVSTDRLRLDLGHVSLTDGAGPYQYEFPSGASASFSFPLSNLDSFRAPGLVTVNVVSVSELNIQEPNTSVSLSGPLPISTYFGTVTYSYTPAAVPEPSGYATLAGMVLIAFGTWRRYRR